jgi:YVTN family beta-propeller protein
MTGDGAYLFVTNGIDGTVTQVDTSTLEVVRTLDVGDSPKTIATYGTTEGPSHQTGPVY